MEYQDLVNSLTPEVVARLKRAIELGRWPDGRVLPTEQREHCMRAVIHWDQAHLSEQDRTGYIDRGHKQGELCDDEETRALRWDEPTKE
ncbi:MAG: DUF1315 family protein [Gammaproteobacteria bacterium]|nr:DUF1315 family protein [Gammaproteobacteria bacterium]